MKQRAVETVCAPLLLQICCIAAVHLSPIVTPTNTLHDIVNILNNHTNLDKKTVSEIVNLTTPTVNRKQCGFRIRSASQGGGAYYVWCDRLMYKIRERKDLIGLSYGISSWDSWSKYLGNIYHIPTQLYDCYSTEKTTPPLTQYHTHYKRYDVCLGNMTKTDSAGRKWETIDMHLKNRPPLSVLVKIDIEGSEWDVFPSFLANLSNTNAVALMDLEFHFCVLDKASPELMVSVFRGLLDDFAVTGRFPDDGRKRIQQYTQNYETNDKCNGMPAMISASYVNKQLLDKNESIS